MVSGKTLTDHGLSLAMDEDCVMVRLLDQDDAICQEEQHYDVADADLTPLPDDSDLDLDIASGDGPGDGAGYAKLAGRVDGARMIYGRLAEQVNVARAGYAQLAERAYWARTDQPRYLAAGMMDPEG